jgi:penicillin-binding protein 1A
MKLLLRLVYVLAAVVVILAAVLGLATAGAYYYVKPSMPAVETLRDVRLQVPLRVYTRDGRLLAEYGEERRIPLTWEEIPEPIVQAFLAAEDDRFFEHPGVDYQGLLRAAISMIRTGGERRQGGGTITMQLARNFFLTREKTISRKTREIFLALRIERQLTKQEILTLYLNKIFLGQRAYGIGAAAEVYFGKPVSALTLAETATIAGLPKAPSLDNPVRDPDRATQRRAYVLRRMLETRSIDESAYQAALAEPMVSHLHSATIEAHAPYVGEMIRREMLNRYGGDAYTAGFSVVTTVDSRLQAAAVGALRTALLEYDRRHGYRGPVDRITLPAEDEGLTTAEQHAALAELLSGYGTVAGLFVGVVTAADDISAAVYVPALERRIGLDLEAVKWARAYIDDNARGPEPKTVSEVVAPGDVIIVWESADAEDVWRLGQVPAVQGAFVALDPMDGAITALSGGFDFQASKFNRVTQARRQPGSSFKPFIYSAALDHGFTTASIVNDAPVVFDDANLEDTWRPENYSRKFYGPTRLREALVRSRNLVSIRVLRGMGVNSAIEHIERFGIPRNVMPRNLSLALGSVNLTPLDVANAYAILANGGYRVSPYVMDRIFDADGEILYAADPLIACAVCEDEAEQAAREAEEKAQEAARRALDSPTGRPAATPIPDQPIQRAPSVVSRQNAWLVADMMRDVVRRGTGRRAMQLGRKDLSGKTGTTNERRDAWFSGFNADIVGTAWVGFDQERPLGAREEGSRTALPMWIGFMREAMDGVPDHTLPKPPGLVTARISPESGELARPGEYGAIFETFRVGHVPELAQDTTESPYEQDEEEEEILF